ncbi:3133_t:CDS:2, partial [Gigaspora rosea]
LELKTRLQSNRFWDELNTIIKILKPIIATIKVFENNNSTILTVYSHFIALKYSADEASRIYAELLKFRNKQTPYNNQIIWNSATHINSTT